MRRYLFKRHIKETLEFYHFKYKGSMHYYVYFLC